MSSLGKGVVLKNVDMSEEMQVGGAQNFSGFTHAYRCKNVLCDRIVQAAAIEVAREAQDKLSIEKDQAAFIKKEFDRRYGPTWHCVVGRNFGSYVTHESKNFIYFYLDQVL